MWEMMVHLGEFEHQITILIQAGFDGLDLVGWKRVGRGSAALPKPEQQLGHPKCPSSWEFGQSGNLMEG